MKNSGEKNLLVTIIKSLIFGFLLLLQYIFVMNIYKFTYEIYIYYTYLFEILKIISIIYIVYKPDNPAFKISWIILIAIMPVVGVVLYFLFGNMKMPKKVKSKVKLVNGKTSLLLDYDNQIEKSLELTDKRIFNSMKYLSNTTKYPIYSNSFVEYLSLGEIYFARMIDDLKLAEKYIFLEYFILADGVIFEKIFKILELKAKSGVEIYVMYDAFGSMFTLSSKVKKRFNAANIKFRSFNKLTPMLTMFLNNRDHRKITVIDGKIAYSGGINIGDEYANINSKYGHWKDSGIRIVGNVVNSYVIMFLRMWSIYEKKDVDYSQFYYKEESIIDSNDGYVMAFSDGPYNDYNVGESIYIDTLNKASNYVYITTPYLIITQEMIISLCNAAISGVDVRIVLPGIPDKKIVYTASRSFYDELLKAGVKIYEYKPGFIHSKTYISDDDIAIVGSINMDYRSFFLHYELATYFYKSNITMQMKKDFFEILKDCKKVELNSWKKRTLIIRLYEAILRTLSSML